MLHHSSLRIRNPLRILSLVALSSTSIAQSLPPTWQAQFDGPAHFNDFATSAAVLPSGDVAVVGTTWMEPQPGVIVPHFFTALYSPQGQELWSRIQDSGPNGSNGMADQVAITPAGKIITAGTRDGGANWMVVQYDAGGSGEWEGLWVANSQSSSHVEDLDIDVYGNVYLCGDISWGAGVAKFSPTGTLLWVQTYHGTGLEIGSVNALAIDATGAVFLTGSTITAAGQLFSVARIDPVNGVPYWIQSFGPPTGFSYSDGGGLGIDGVGQVVACGLISDFASTSVSISFVALAPDGTLVWQYDHIEPTAVWGVVEDVVVDAAGNIAAAGWTASPAWDGDGFVVRMNGSTFAWERTFAGSSHLDDRAVAVELDAFGNVYAAAVVQDPTLGFDVFEYSPTGGLIAHGRAPVPAQGNGSARDLAVGTGGRAYVVGNMAIFPLTGGDALTAAFDLGPPVQAVCFGDGSGTACPCANESAVGANVGCLNSIGTAGGLSADGAARVSADTLTLHAAEVPNGPGLYFQGSSVAGGGVGFLFGDGLLCVSGSIVRLGVVFASSNASTYPGGTTPAPISVGGSCAPSDTCHYQVWYRDASTSFCTSAVFNLTNALSLTWGS